MACSCTALKAEVLAQRELMAEWFEALRVEIRDAKAEIVEIIKANTFSVGEEQKITKQPLTGQQYSVVEPIFANAFLDTINSPLQCAGAISNFNSVSLSLESTQNPETEQLTVDPTLITELISPKIEPIAEEKSVEFSLTKSNYSDETLCERAKTTSPLNLFSTVESENLSGATVKNEQIKTVSSKKPFSCNHCDYICATKWNLFRHIRSHTDEKPFGCRLCQKHFKHHYNLTRHVMSHTGEKPLKCEICDFRCRRRTGLIRHKRLHTGEKPFSCDQCAFRAHGRSEIKRHQKVHTGEKPFACDQCDFRTGLKLSLENHQRIHTGEKPFQCDLCDFRTISRSTLFNHRKRKHQRQVDSTI